MTKTHIYVEGANPSNAPRSKVSRIACQNGFSKLLENCGYAGHMPTVVACGGRRAVYERFKTAHAASTDVFVVLLVDSEDPVADILKPWTHLKKRQGDGWDRPMGANDEQVFLMTTSMETWIAADPSTLVKHYNSKFNASVLPPLHTLEGRHRHEVREKLEDATRQCGKEQKYEKNQRSFELLGKLDCCTLRDNLPSFSRMIEILDQKLGCSHSPCPGEETVNTDGGH